MSQEAYIYDAIRSPRGKGKKGSLNELTAVSLSAKILSEIRDRNNLDTSKIEDVIWGNVTQVGEQGGCLARSAVLAANYSESTPGLSINRFCASGLEAVCKWFVSGLHVDCKWFSRWFACCLAGGL